MNVSATNEIKAVLAIKQAMPFSEDRHRPLKRVGPGHQITLGSCCFEMDQRTRMLPPPLLLTHAREGCLQKLSALLQSGMFFLRQLGFEHADNAIASDYAGQR